MFGCFFLSLNSRYSSLITLKYHVCLAPLLTSHHSIFFTLFVGPIPVTRCSFFFLQYPNSPNLVEKKKKKEKETQNRPNQWKKKKKKNRTTNIGEEREKKKSKSVAEYCLWIPYVCLITILPLIYELWKLKTVKMCFQFL